MKQTLLLAALAATLSSCVPTIEPAKAVPCKELRIRKEWRSLTVDQRKKYIKSVQCLLSKEPVTKATFPVVTNRYEDFVALHANASAGGKDLSKGFAMVLGLGDGIHFTGTFMPWHRYVIWVYESTLRDECGWDMGQPYWDWHLDTKEAGGDWSKSPLFDDNSGFGGNGIKVDNPFADMLNMPGMPGMPSMPKMPDMDGHSHSHSQPSSSDRPKGLPNGLPKGFPADFLKGFPGGFPKGVPSGLAKGLPGGLPPGGFPFPGGEMFMGGTGGGCVSSGPFKDMKLHIGPFGMMKENNTRCLKRNFNPGLANAAASKQVLDRILNSKNFGEFRQRIEVPSFGSTNGFKIGPDFHSLGHGGVGGEMTDPLVSTNDPLFFMHHSGLDHLWAIWQEKDRKSRLWDVEGDASGFLGLPQKGLTLDTPIWMGLAAPDRPVRDVMDTVNENGKGFLCYKYGG